MDPGDLGVIMNLKNPYDPWDQWPLFFNMHVKCPIVSAKDDEDAESNVLHNNDWINLQGIAKVTKCGRFCLTVGGNIHLRNKSVTPVGNDWNHLQRHFCRQFSIA